MIMLLDFETAVVLAFVGLMTTLCVVRLMKTNIR